MSPIDLDRLRIAPRAKQARGDMPARAKLRQGFVKGPIPLPWLEAAARLPGKSIHAGIALWYVAGLTRSRSVPLSNIAGCQHEWTCPVALQQPRAKATVSAP